LSLRRDLLKAYLLLYPENIGSKRAKSHVYWIIENAPQVDGEWFEWQMHFSGSSEDERRKLVGMFQAAIKKSPQKNEILKNAAFFFGALDEEYALNCLDKLIRCNQLDPEAYYKMASICGNSYLFLNGQRESGEKAEKVLRILFKIPWSEENYIKFWRFGQKHPYLVNKCTTYFFLSIISLWCWRPAWRNCSVLSFALSIALKLKDDEFANLVYSRINTIFFKKIDELGLEEKLNLYSVLARYEIRAKKHEKAQALLEKIFQIPIKRDHLHYATTLLVLEELVSQGEKDTSKYFFDCIVRFHKPNEEILKDLKKLMI
jgi:hypothetical protein